MVVTPKKASIKKLPSRSLKNAARSFGIRLTTNVKKTVNGKKVTYRRPKSFGTLSRQVNNKMKKISQKRKFGLGECTVIPNISNPTLIKYYKYFKVVNDENEAIHAMSILFDEILTSTLSNQLSELEVKYFLNVLNIFKNCGYASDNTDYFKNLIKILKFNIHHYDNIDKNNVFKKLDKKFIDYINSLGDFDKNDITELKLSFSFGSKYKRISKKKFGVKEKTQLSSAERRRHKLETDAYLRDWQLSVGSGEKQTSIKSGSKYGKSKKH